jgi:hypothetical protein
MWSVVHGALVSRTAVPQESTKLGSNKSPTLNTPMCVAVAGPSPPVLLPLVKEIQKERKLVCVHDDQGKKQGPCLHF